MGSVTIKAYASATCVLLAFDWPDGADHQDFLGFAIRRTPGYRGVKTVQYLTNKLDFTPITPASKPKPSNEAPFQKFNWWDSGFEVSDRGKTFTYEVVPVLGAPGDLKLQEAARASIKVELPNFLENGIATYFNRAVVSSQAFATDVKKLPLEKQMDWLANGLQEAVPEALRESAAFDCAIYHLSDTRWVLPAFEGFGGRGSLTYFAKAKDLKSEAGVALLSKKTNISKHKRDKIRSLMHDKFIVAYRDGKPSAVLTGSTNFTPEAQTIQANLLHIVHSPEIAALYAQRAHLLAANQDTKTIAKSAGWSGVMSVGTARIRVYFTPEPGKRREYLDTVAAAVGAAKSSVLFCMFTASDSKLMDAIFAKGDSDDHLIYGLLNAIDDPSAPTKSGKPRKLPAIAATIFHRSQDQKDTLPYSAFGKEAPAGFLPELRAIDVSKYDASAKRGARGGGHGPPTIHVHHKFIVIDGDTDASAENANDENELEIKGDVTLARVYVAEFMRLYNHYRARALWERQAGRHPAGDALVLAKTRDGWVRDAYKRGAKAYLARTRGL